MRKRKSKVPPPRWHEVTPRTVERSGKLRIIGIVFFLLLVLSSCTLKTPNKSNNSDQPSKPDELDILDKPILSFSIISDPESDIENLKKALQKTKEKNLKFVIIPGDLTQTGTPEELDQVKQTLQESKLDYYLIPGNHDIWYSRKKNTHTFNQFFGPSYYAKEIGDYQFIFLDNSDEYLGMGAPQLSWLEVKLLNLKPLNFFIFSHIPFFHPQSPKAMGELNAKLKIEAQDLLNKFCQNPPLAIFSGHLHRTEDYGYS
ncbi:unnamed protein product, partial [marine sediment metagenome]